MIFGSFCPVGCALSVPIIATLNDGATRLQRHSGDAGLALVEPSVR